MAYPGSPLRAGSSASDSVKVLQERLNELKIAEIGGAKKLVADGIFGPATENAVRLFQAQSVDEDGNPLTVDGVVGPVTWAALFRSAIPLNQAADNALLGAVLNVAAGEVGVREQPLGSNRGPRVDEYLECCGLNPAKGCYAWCTAFLYFCFNEAANSLGQRNPLPKTAGVLDLWNRLGSSGRYRITPRQAVDRPELVKPGMLFFLNAGGGFGHVGLIRAVRGVTLVTVEGNTTDKLGSREGIGVFERDRRSIPAVNLGFADATRSFAQ